MDPSATPSFPASAFQRQDETPDAEFYHQPRFVTHIDDPAIAAVTQLYREYFLPDSAVLDLMSSWVSHLPPEVTYRRVVGLGMNAAELAANPRLESFVVQDLNQQPILPFADQEFDGAAICVSIDYLTQPVAVLRELARVLRPDAPLVITFSNRCFPSKAIAAWHRLDDRGHLALVQQYLLAAGGWRGMELMDRSPRPLRPAVCRGGAGRRAGPPDYKCRSTRIKQHAIPSLPKNLAWPGWFRLCFHTGLREVVRWSFTQCPAMLRRSAVLADKHCETLRF